VSRLIFLNTQVYTETVVSFSFIQKKIKMRQFFIKLLFVVLAAISGTALTIYIVRYANVNQGAVDLQGWKTMTSISSKPVHEGPIHKLYRRAIVAVRGLLALSPKEAIYLIKDTDDNGQKLMANCTYTLTGGDFPARWWSITAYAHDYFLFEAPNNNYSIDKSRAQLDTHHTFRVTLSPKPSDGFWIPTTGHEPYLLTLRLYNVEDAFLNNPAILQPPKIRREGECS
jgi:hypothetical protein